MTHRARPTDEDPLPSWLARYAEERWTSASGDTSRRYLILPDNCMDIIHTQGAWTVHGPSTQAIEVVAGPHEEAWGLRFGPGVLPLLTGLDARDLLNGCAPLEALQLPWEESQQRLDQARADGTLAMLRGLTASQRHRVEQIAGELGWSARQVQRKLKPLLGYTARQWLRVRRLKVVAQRITTDDLSELAHRAGFADQAHMTRECKALTGLTPAALRAEHALFAPDP